MRVLYFHQHFSTPEGATGIRSYEMARRLVEHGHEVTMVCGAYSAAQTGLVGRYKWGQRIGVVDGIKVIEIALPYANRFGLIQRTALFLLFALRSIWIALREPCDLVFATSTPLTAAIPGIAAKWLRRKPFVFEVRDLWPELPKAMGAIRNPLVLWLLDKLEWTAYRSADRVIALSPGMKEGVCRRNIPASSVEVIPNGCDLGIFSPDVIPQRPLGVSSRQLLAIYSGTHGLANGLDSVLDAAAELKRHGRDDIVLMLVGEGRCKTELQARARREELNNVIFRGSMPKQQLAQLLSSADVGLQVLSNVPAFYYGTSPNKFFDYLAAGKAVLCNYPGWVSELIENTGCGFVVPPEDPIAFAEALEHAADERIVTREKGVRARKLAEMDFDRGDLAERFVVWVTGGSFFEKTV